MPGGNESDNVLSIKGVVKSHIDNQPLPGVNIVIESLGLDLQTNSSGKYSFGALAAGTYTLRFSVPTFTTQELPCNGC